jgi:UPF0271 protein
VSQVYVVDAGVLFSTWPMTIIDATLVTTSNILVEVRNRPSKLRVEVLLLLDSMRAVNPDDIFIQQVSDAAVAAGDKSVLSENDIELIALAFMLKEDDREVTLVSTDFAVLNTASHLNIAILDPGGNFKREITWLMRCPACNYRSEKPTRDTECPVCGTPMRRTPLKGKKKSKKR